MGNLPLGEGVFWNETQQFQPLELKALLPADKTYQPAVTSPVSKTRARDFAHIAT